MVFTCPNCGTQMNVPDNCSQFRCPSCSSILSAPVQPNIYNTRASMNQNMYNSGMDMSNYGYQNPYLSQPAMNLQPSALELFKRVDTDQNGILDAKELQIALSSGGLRFQLSTVFLLLGKFDNDKDNCINFNEFQQLLSEVWTWKQTFDYYDTDHSGGIDVNEFFMVLKKNGYQYPDTVCRTIFNSADSDRSGIMELDEFIQIMCEIQLLVYKFQQYDVTRQNSITVDLTQLTDIVFSSRR